MASLGVLLSRRREKKKELEIYRKRKKNVQKINQNLNTSFDDNIVEAIRSDERSEAELRRGIQGAVAQINSVAANIEAMKEKYIWQDGNLSDASSNLDAEVSRCSSEISRLEMEIRSLDRQIEAAREAEMEG